MPINVKLKRKYDPADHRRSAYRVTLFLPQGRYPQGTFCSPTGLFHADPEVVFAVTFGPPWHVVGDDLPYSEADWLLPDTVRLLGSLILTERFPDQRCGFYPLPYGGLVLDSGGVDLTQPETASAVKLALFRTVHNRLWARHQVDRYWRQCLGHTFFLFEPHSRVTAVLATHQVLALKDAPYYVADPMSAPLVSVCRDVQNAPAQTPRCAASLELVTHPVNRGIRASSRCINDFALPAGAVPDAAQSSVILSSTTH